MAKKRKTHTQSKKGLRRTIQQMVDKALRRANRKGKKKKKGS